MLGVGRGGGDFFLDVFLEYCLVYLVSIYRGSKVKCFFVKWKLVEIRWKVFFFIGG